MAISSNLIEQYGHMSFKPGSHCEGEYGGWILNMTLRGEVLMLHDDGDHLFRGGEVLISKPGPLAWRVPSKDEVDGASGRKWEVVWFHLYTNEEILGLLKYPPTCGDFSILRLSRRNRLQVSRALLKAYRIKSSFIPSLEKLAFHSVKEALLWCAYDHGWNTGGTDPRLERVLAFMGARISSDIMVEDLAKVAGISRSGFMAMFSREFGISPMAYLEKRRMERARELLGSGMMYVKEVSAQVGYSDPIYFARRFKSIMGMPPRECRKSHN